MMNSSLFSGLVWELRLRNHTTKCAAWIVIIDFSVECAADQFGAKSSKVKCKGGEPIRLDLKLKG